MLQNVESRLVEMEMSKMSYLYNKFSYFKEERRGRFDVVKTSVAPEKIEAPQLSISVTCLSVSAE